MRLPETLTIRRVPFLPLIKKELWEMLSGRALWTMLLLVCPLLGYSYWLVYRPSTRACGDGEACARPLPNRIVKTSLILATILLVAALGLDFIAPLFLNS